MFFSIYQQRKQEGVVMIPDWVNVTQAVKILGLPRQTLMSKIHNACIPFRMVGNQYRINIKIARAYLAREDIANMEAVKKELSLTPLSRGKTKVRKVIE